MLKNDGKSSEVRVFSQNPAGLPLHVGSIPTSGTNDFDNFPSTVLDFIFCGAVAQLGERLNGIQEADGSIPFSSTI